LSRRSAKHEAGSGDRYIAWGVSPRYKTENKEALKGRQIITEMTVEPADGVWMITGSERVQEKRL
jgi:hypothetical protein